MEQAKPPASDQPDDTSKTTGQLNDIFVTVNWTRRADRIRIISVRRARDGERSEYGALNPG